jgi:hypothetical protein
MLKTSALALALVPFAPALAGGEGCLDIPSTRSTAYQITDGDNSSSCGEIDVKEREDAIWFRVDGQSWVVRDPAVVAEGQRLFARVSEIGAEQGKLGAKQGRLGAEQGRIGAEQGKIGARQAVAALRDEEVEDYGARMAELGEEMARLGRQQAVLGDQQRELGETMRREIAVAQKGLSRLLEKAMKDGTAVRASRL